MNATSGFSSTGSRSKTSRFSIRRLSSVDSDTAANSNGPGSYSKWHGNGTTVVDLAFTVADFFSQLSGVQQRYSEEVSKLVRKFKERTQPFSDRCPESCGCVQSSWSDFLDGLLASNEGTAKLSSAVGEHGISSQLSDIAKYRTDLLSEVTSYHNKFLSQLERAEKHLAQIEIDYHGSWSRMNTEGADPKNPSTARCYNLLNEYVLQLAGTNLNETTVCEVTLNKTLADLEAIQCDIQEAIAFSLNRYARLFQTELLDQMTRLDELITSTRKDNHLQAAQDLSVLCNITRPEAKTFDFLSITKEQDEFNSCKLVVNKATEPALQQRYQQLTQQVRDLEERLASSRESLALHRKQLESQKATEKAALIAKTLSEIHCVKNDIRSQELNLVINQQQVSLFPTDWVPSIPHHSNGVTQSSHSLQDYNYIKPTVCYMCKAPLKGLKKQGLRCKVCKVSIHHKCQSNLPECSVLSQEKSAKASSKKIFRRQNSVHDIRVSLADKKKLLRRQKSSSSLEVNEESLRVREVQRSGTSSQSIDPVYETIRNAASMSISETRPPTRLSDRKEEDETFLTAPESASLSKSAPHSPSHTSDTRRKKLSMCGKSVSLDNEHSVKQKERSWIVAADPENSKPKISANTFVVLYDFEGMLRDDLTIRAGEVIRILSIKNSDWWKGEVNGCVGFFPSFCVTPLHPNESVMQVISTVRAQQEHNDRIILRKHQIVIMVPDSEEKGWVRVRTSLESGYYPLSGLHCIDQPSIAEQ